MSNFTKTNPNLSYTDFYNLVADTVTFESLTGKQYSVISIEKDIMKLERMSHNTIWKMNLSAVHQAYLELESFQTKDFKPYMSRTKSPALGLLLTLGLLKK